MQRVVLPSYPSDSSWRRRSRVPARRPRPGGPAEPLRLPRRTGIELTRVNLRTGAVEGRSLRVGRRGSPGTVRDRRRPARCSSPSRRRTRRTPSTGAPARAEALPRRRCRRRRQPRRAPVRAGLRSGRPPSARPALGTGPAIQGPSRRGRRRHELHAGRTDGGELGRRRERDRLGRRARRAPRDLLRPQRGRRPTWPSPPTVARSTAQGPTVARSCGTWPATGGSIQPFEAGRPFATDDGDQYPVELALSPDGRTLARTHDDGTVELIDTRTLRRRGLVRALRGFAAAVDFSPDGRLLAVSGEGGQVTLWDARTLRSAGPELSGAADHLPGARLLTGRRAARRRRERPAQRADTKFKGAKRQGVGRAPTRPDWRALHGVVAFGRVQPRRRAAGRGGPRAPHRDPRRAQRRARREASHRRLGAVGGVLPRRQPGRHRGLGRQGTALVDRDVGAGRAARSRATRRGS